MSRPTSGDSPRFPHSGTQVHAGLPEEYNVVHKIGVLGSGAFGTALAQVAARSKHEVIMYARDEGVVESINTKHRNPKYDYLEEHILLDNITATTDLEKCCNDADILLLCLPAQKTPDFLREHRDKISSETILCCTSKGLYVPTQQLLGDAMMDALEREQQPLCFLSGPSFAKEMLQDMPTAVVVASKLLYHAVKVQRALSSRTFRIYSSQDVVGVQLGGALKNPLAIGAGMIEGAGFGINTLAAFVTRSSNELRQLCIAMGGNPDTVSGLSGIGDLMLTAFGSMSRNRTLGCEIMKHRDLTLDEIMKGKTVEGVPTASVAVAYANKCGLDVPIFRMVAGLLSGDVKPDEAQDLLMNRPLRRED